MSKKLLKSETFVNRQEAAEKLRNMADKIQEGKLTLESGNDSVELHPAERVEFEIDVEEESDGDISIEIELEWPEDDSQEDVKIS